MSQGLLIDGTAPLSAFELLKRLEDLGFVSRTFAHDPVFTVAEAKALRGSIEGAHTKNLFVRWQTTSPEPFKLRSTRA